MNSILESNSNEDKHWSQVDQDQIPVPEHTCKSCNCHIQEGQEVSRYNMAMSTDFGPMAGVYYNCDCGSTILVKAVKYLAWLDSYIKGQVK